MNSGETGGYSVDELGDGGTWNTAVAEELRKSEQCYEMLRR